MRMGLLRVGCAVVCLARFPMLSSPPHEPWLRLRTPHFELLTTANEPDARACISHFERLRRFYLARSTVAGEETGTVRIIAFRSPSEYAPYRLHDNTDGYYVAAGSRDYIVMASLGDSQLSAAAHEYAHLVARRQGLALPLWLAEGLAEVFSTVRFEPGQALVGAPPPARLRQLRGTPWLPLADLLAVHDTHSFSGEQRSLFYAESWALTHMLMFSPRYSSRLGDLPTRASGIEASASLESDLRAWVNASRWPSMQLPSGGDSDPAFTVDAIAPFDAQVALASISTRNSSVNTIECLAMRQGLRQIG